MNKKIQIILLIFYFMLLEILAYLCFNSNNTELFFNIYIALAFMLTFIFYAFLFITTYKKIIPFFSQKRGISGAIDARANERYMLFKEPDRLKEIKKNPELILYKKNLYKWLKITIVLWVLGAVLLIINGLCSNL